MERPRYEISPCSPAPSWFPGLFADTREGWQLLRLPGAGRATINPCREVLLQVARREAARGGGLVIVYDAKREITAAWEWLDAREIEEDAPPGHFIERRVDPKLLRLD